MIHFRVFLLTITVLLTLTISASADDAIVIGGAKQPDAGNATAGSDSDAVSTEISGADSVESVTPDGEKIPLIFSLDDLISYGIRHSPNLKRLGLDVDLVTLERDATLFFTDPSLRIQGSVFYRENEVSVTGGTTATTESKGASYDLSLTKPYESGDTFTVGHSIDYTDVDMTAGSVSDTWAQSLTASYTWPLYKDRGEDVTLYNFKLKQNSLELKSDEIVDATRTLAISVASQYFTIAYLKENIRVQKETLDYYLKLLDRNIEREKVGLSLKSDILQAENAALSAEVDIAKITTQLDNTMRSLSELIGYSEGAPIEIAPLSIDTFAPTNLHKEDLWNKILASSYSLKQLDSVEVTYGLSDIYYENQLKPDLDLTASVATEGDADDFGASFGDVTDSQNFALTLTYNLPWGKRELKNRIEQNAISRKELTEQRRQVVESLRTKYENLKRDIDTTIKTLELMQSNIAVAEENANILRERHRVGFGTTLDVLDGERLLLQAKLSYINAIADHLQSEYELQVLAGMAP